MTDWGNLINMIEVATDALVIDKEPSGEYNSRVFLYTEKLGGVVARATSLRKLTSKMAAHLEPLTFARVRLIQKNANGGFQIADALTIDRVAGWRKSPEFLAEGLKLISIFKESGFAGDADELAWKVLFEIFINPPLEPARQYGRRILNILGYDHRNALCGLCGTGRPKIFSIRDLVFYCEACLSGVRVA